MAYIDLSAESSSAIEEPGDKRDKRKPLRILLFGSVWIGAIYLLRKQKSPRKKIKIEISDVASCIAIASLCDDILVWSTEK